jgi:hypothetical protein
VIHQPRLGQLARKAASGNSREASVLVIISVNGTAWEYCSNIENRHKRSSVVCSQTSHHVNA